MGLNRSHWKKHGARVYRSKRWQAVRFMARRRDGFACVECGSRERLEVDHVKAIRDGGDPYALENLQTLCRECHSRKTRIEVDLRKALPPARQAWRDLLSKQPARKDNPCWAV